MSAIFGQIRPDPTPVVAVELEPMAQAMHWRGPDGQASWCGAGAVLGAMWLKSTPWAGHERLPVVDEEHGLVLAADARLDDRSGLARKLGLADAARLPDSALILAAWKRWGEECPRYLLGDFALAIWQVRERRLFLARDSQGLKPLYLQQDGERLAFASSARAVARAPGVDAAIDPARVADFLAGLEGVDERCTFFRGVSRLSPAHSAVFQDGRLTLRRYWRAAPGPELRLGSDAAYLEAFEEVFEQAVADRLAGPAACMLSGGLDSSSIVAVARDLCMERGDPLLATFSAVSAAPEGCAESASIDRVIGQGGLDPVCLDPAAEGLRGEGLDRVFASAEEPWETMHLIAGLIYRSAWTRGHRAVLDGVDGDLVLALPESYPARLAGSGHWLAGWREARDQSRNYFQTEPSAREFLYRAVGAALPPVIHRARRAWLRRSHAPHEPEGGLVAPELATTVDLAGRVEQEERAGAAPPGASLRECCAHRMTAPYLTAAIERYERLAAVCGIESRKPLLDRRVIEFSLSLPWRQKARNGWSKYILRRLAARRLPPEIAWRKGFEHLSEEFRQARFRALRADYRSALDRHRERLSPWVHPGRYRAIVNDLEGGQSPDMEAARKLVELAAWLERNGG